VSDPVPHLVVTSTVMRMATTDSDDEPCPVPVVSERAGRFAVVTPFAASSDQQRAVNELAQAIETDQTPVTLLGITGSGKSAVMAWTIERLQRPALILAPNKALAAQLAAELRAMLPHNAVSFFVSYYDYYQPEAYVAASDTYIAKEAQINDEIDRLRHEATVSLVTRRDSVVVATVSAIYGLGTPADYRASVLHLTPGGQLEPLDLARQLVAIGYSRNDTAPSRGQFRVRGDTIELHPSEGRERQRVSFYGDTIELLEWLDPSGAPMAAVPHLTITPTSHWTYHNDRLRAAIDTINAELTQRVDELTQAGRIVEAQRLSQRTRHDIELLEVTGTCPGVENYSRHLDGRTGGQAPATLLDYLDDEAIVFIDESHVTLGQLQAAASGDRARKTNLIDHGFRLPSARDNRPLTFDEFRAVARQVVFVSATPGRIEQDWATATVELVTRPTGLLDPTITVHPRRGQLDDLVARVQTVCGRQERALVTCTTKRGAEDLVDWLVGQGVRARWLHSDLDTIERQKLLRDLRLGAFDVLVGVNLLREGLDLPEVSLVAVLDADVDGFLRSTSALLQTIGRAARNAHGDVVLYADRVSDAMAAAIHETERRRNRQQAVNLAAGVTPQSLTTPIRDLVLADGARDTSRRGEGRRGADRWGAGRWGDGGDTGILGQGEVWPEVATLDDAQLLERLQHASSQMHQAAAELAFEAAGWWRDRLEGAEAEFARRNPLGGTGDAPVPV